MNGRERMAAFDEMQRTRIRELTDAGEPLYRATERVKHETRAEYFTILRECGDLPVYAIPFPGPLPDPPPRAA